MQRIYRSLEDKSIKESIYRDFESSQDSVMEIQREETQELIYDLRADYGMSEAGDFDSNLAQSIQLDYDSSYELLSSTSDLDMTRS